MSRPLPPSIDSSTIIYSISSWLIWVGQSSWFRIYLNPVLSPSGGPGQIRTGTIVRMIPFSKQLVSAWGHPRVPSDLGPGGNCGWKPVKVLQPSSEPGCRDQPPRGAPWVSGLVGHFVLTWPNSECSHTVQFLDSAVLRP